MRFALAFLALATPAFADDPPKPVSAPLSPDETIRRATLPDGFRMTVFAAEPDVVQPIAFTIDDRGRLWVVEGLSYPTWITDGKPGRDRVIILEDTDGDGRHDKRTVFLDNGSNLSGIELGFGGVFLCSCPNIIFIPDRDGDDKPDGPPEVLLDGWDLKSRHNVVNGLHWGPDGWLYGLNGILSNSKVGKPGTPEDQRTFLNCGVWRYHPTKKTFEVVAHGTTNPWGMDWDEQGRLFITNCVIEHVFHVIPGGHYKRMFGQDAMPHSYELLQTCADHIHWGGGRWTDSRGGVGIHDEAGGGHAHVGCMIYYGDNWPKEYRGNLFTVNVHGTRVNRDRIKPHGSGVVVEHAPDFLRIPDPWFRGLELKYGPDGGVYLTDWCDDGECHDYTEQDINRQNGRIYKITYGTPKPVAANVSRLSDKELVELHNKGNDWSMKRARRNLQQRAAAGALSSDAANELIGEAMCPSGTSPEMCAQHLWTLHGLSHLTKTPQATDLLIGREDTATAAVSLAFEKGPIRPSDVEYLTKLATEKRPPAVRLALASALQKIPIEQRWTLAEALVVHAEDADDHNIPLMVWYGIEPLVAADPDKALSWLTRPGLPQVRRYVTHRMISLGDQHLAPVLAALGSESTTAEAKGDILLGMLQAYEGRRSVEPPSEWKGLYEKLLRVADIVSQPPRAPADLNLRTRATQLAVLFGDPTAIERLTSTLQDAKANTNLREQALQSLLPRRDPALVPVLYSLLTDAAVRSAVIRGLAAFENPDLPEKLIATYPACTDAEKQDVVATLAMRHKSAEALIAAMERQKIPPRDVSTVAVRQIQALKSAEFNARLAKVWGSIRPTAGDKAELLAKYRSQLSDEVLKKADRSHGRVVFTKICANCHKLFDEGRAVGPELTGSQRRNVEYILENLLDPSAVVGRDYQLATVVTKDGRVINGVVKQENDNALVILTERDQVTVPREDIDDYKRQAVSMMPEGVLQKLTNDEIRDLMGYLGGETQAPLPK